MKRREFMRAMTGALVIQKAAAVGRADLLPFFVSTPLPEGAMTVEDWAAAMAHKSPVELWTPRRAVVEVLASCDVVPFEDGISTFRYGLRRLCANTPAQ